MVQDTDRFDNLETLFQRVKAKDVGLCKLDIINVITPCPVYSIGKAGPAQVDRKEGKWRRERDSNPR